jgi:mycobactin lysine-N-oxygenase
VHKSLIIIGGGPKALAIAAKATALKQLGYLVPEIVIIEKYEIAANWLGERGYTDGKQLLGTAPAKDVGFPYSTKIFDRSVDPYMLQHYSWPAYNIRLASDLYGEQIDRGVTQQPVHVEWAQYLKWVADNVDASIIIGEVLAINHNNERWHLRYLSPKNDILEIDGDGLVITGPGPAKQIQGQSKHPRIFDGQTFWCHLDSFREASKYSLPIGVVGTGETAASVVVALVRVLREEVPILVINRQGTIFSRGESYFENKMFTDPEDQWDFLPYETKVELIKRTDRGVFSVKSMADLGQIRNVIHQRINVTGIEIDNSEDPTVPEGLPKIIGPPNVPLSYLIVAKGFEAWWFVDLIKDDPYLKALLSNNRNDIEKEIEEDLSLPEHRLPHLKLHVPMLAGIAQGPGFPNLSCLGLLAERILKSYVSRSS